MYLQNLSLIFLVAFIALAHGLDKKRDCKCRLNNVNARIIGGRNAASNKYPWFASMTKTGFHKYSDLLHYADDEYRSRDSTCGATILNERWIMTAAHCLPKKSIKGIAIGFGDNDLKVQFDNGKLPAKRMIPFPMFNDFGDVNDDIALIELAEPLNFTDKISPGCLGINYRSEPENTLLSIGHGIMDYNNYYIKERRFEEGHISRYLKETEVQDISTIDESCKFTPNTICVKSRKDGDSICQGDSGSPVHYTKNGRTFVLGVLSTSKMGQIDENKWSYCVGLGFYQRVAPYINFIQHHAGDVCTDVDVEE